MKLGIREIVFLTILLGLLGCAYALVFQKADEKRARLTGDIEAKTAQLENLRQATAGIEDLNRKVEELQQAIVFFESKLPQAKEVDKILKEVWQMAEANSLQTKTVKTLRSERNATYSEQPIEMTLSGNFYGYYSFLQQLEKLPRITRLTRMELKKINDRDGDMEAVMTLSIFFEPASAQESVASTH